MDFALRDGVGADLPALQAVYRKSSLSNEGDREILLAHPAALEFSGTSLALGRVRVATDESGTIIGFATSRAVEPGLELEDLFVDPAWFRRGVGRALIDDVLLFATGEGITRVEVTGNPHALAFYEEVGFVVDSEVRTELGFGYRLHLDVTRGSAVQLVIAVDDPRAVDVRRLLETHLAFSRAVTPAEYAFALDVEGLLDPAVTFFSARQAGDLLGVGALKRLDESHAELKSMHTRQAARRRGVGRAMVEHLLTVARQQGYGRVSLETGTTDDFAAARALYRQAGFRPCEPFGDYQASPHNYWMTIGLDQLGPTE